MKEAARGILFPGRGATTASPRALDGQVGQLCPSQRARMGSVDLYLAWAIATATRLSSGAPLRKTNPNPKVALEASLAIRAPCPTGLAQEEQLHQKDSHQASTTSL